LSFPSFNASRVSSSCVSSWNSVQALSQVSSLKLVGEEYLRGRHAYYTVYVACFLIFELGPTLRDTHQISGPLIRFRPSGAVPGRWGLRRVEHLQCSVLEPMACAFAWWGPLTPPGPSPLDLARNLSIQEDQWAPTNDASRQPPVPPLPALDGGCFAQIVIVNCQSPKKFLASRFFTHATNSLSCGKQPMRGSRRFESRRHPAWCRPNRCGLMREQDIFVKTHDYQDSTLPLGPTADLRTEAWRSRCDVTAIPRLSVL